MKCIVEISNISLYMYLFSKLERLIKNNLILYYLLLFMNL